MSVEVTVWDQSEEFAVGLWLDSKFKKSGSVRTHTAYEDAINSFRFGVREYGGLKADPGTIALAAEAWAGHSVVGTDVAASTFNTRLAILSSFYSWCVKMDLLVKINPITRIERRSVQNYHSATPLTASAAKERLQAIDRTTLAGKRDYALLLVALTTGRRLSEIANLRWEDISHTDGRVVITWRRTKGGKKMRDKLSLAASQALSEWQNVLYPDYSNAVWVSLARNQSNGQPLGIQGISDICKKRMGTSKFHTLRHTYAHVMEDLGAKVSVIQARLGHSNIGTTGRYLSALRSEENEFAEPLAQLFA
jgi:integrase/recombinase XerC